MFNLRRQFQKEFNSFIKMLHKGELMTIQIMFEENDLSELQQFLNTPEYDSLVQEMT